MRLLSFSLLRACLVGAALLSTSAPALEPQAKKKGTDPKAPAKKDDKKGREDAALEKSLLRATEKVQTAHLKELEKIVSWAASNGLKDEAQRLAEKMRAIDADYAGLEKLEAALAKAQPAKEEAKAAELKTAFAKRLEEANDKNAKRLFDLATSCMKVSLFTRAYDLVNAVVEADPDHKRAHEVLGYVWDSSAKAWITKWEAEMRKKSVLTDEGWVKKEDKKKWDSGLREYNGKWVPKDEEERIRKRNEYNPFSAETEHFRVESNLGRRQAFEFATMLEDFYREFFRFYIGYYDQVAGAKLLFNQAKLKKKHRVMVFPSRVEYLTFVKADKGNDELLVRSAGFFASTDARSYFYWSENPEATYSTLYHEVTHQLLSETKDWGNPSSGKMWVVEGIATYMETWEKVDGKWKPGHKVGIPELQHVMSFLKQSSDWSLGGYISIEHKQFHEPSQRMHNYSVGGALCHFFLHYEGEIYKEGFVRFLRDFYGGKASGDGVLKYLDVEGADGDAAKIQILDRQFREHMSRLEGGLAGETKEKKSNTQGESTGQ